MDHEEVKARAYEFTLEKRWRSITDIGSMVWYPYRSHPDRETLATALDAVLEELVMEGLLERRLIPHGVGLEYRRGDLLESLGRQAD